MSDMILNSRTLPEPLFQLIRTEKVKVSEINGFISLIPIIDGDDCPLRGIAADSGLTVEKFLAMKREDKELEKY